MQGRAPNTVTPESLVPGETWRPVPGFPRYEISDQGRVISRVRKTPIFLRPGLSGGTYLSAALSRDGVRRDHYVHALVAAAFIGPRPEGMEVRHLDGDPSNNRLDNLAYGTTSDNAQDRIRHGRDQNARKTHCKRGHEFTEANTIRYRNTRRCRICVAALSRAYIVERDRIHGNQAADR